jgi:hypothetical protein
MVVGGGPTNSIHHYELKAAYANINHFHPSLRIFWQMEQAPVH